MGGQHAQRDDGAPLDGADREAGFVGRHASLLIVEVKMYMETKRGVNAPVTACEASCSSPGIRAASARRCTPGACSRPCGRASRRALIGSGSLVALRASFSSAVRIATAVSRRCTTRPRGGRRRSVRVELAVVVGGADVPVTALRVEEDGAGMAPAG